MSGKRNQDGETLLQWQEKNRYFVIIKATMLLAIFWTIALIWFVAGTISFGLLWPRSIRKFIFGQGLNGKNVGCSSEENAAPKMPKQPDAVMETRYDKIMETKTDAFVEMAAVNKMSPDDVLKTLKSILSQVEVDGDLSHTDEDDDDDASLPPFTPEAEWQMSAGY